MSRRERTLVDITLEDILKKNSDRKELQNKAIELSIRQSYSKDPKEIKLLEKSIKAVNKAITEVKALETELLSQASSEVFSEYTAFLKNSSIFVRPSCCTFSQSKYRSAFSWFRNYRFFRKP